MLPDFVLPLGHEIEEWGGDAGFAYIFFDESRPWSTRTGGLRRFLSLKGFVDGFRGNSMGRPNN